MVFIVGVFFEGKKEYSIPQMVWFWVEFAILFLLIGFRDHIGSDSIGYESDYRYVPSLYNLNSSFFEQSRYQPGFIFLESFCKQIGDEFYIFQVVHVLIFNMIVFFFIKRNTNYCFAALLSYVCISMLYFNTEILRESLSVALGLLALFFYKKKKYYLAILLFFLAWNFHVSSIVILLYPIVNIVKTSNLSIMIMAILLFFIPFSFNYIPNIDNALLYFGGDKADMTHAYSIHDIQYNFFYYALRYTYAVGIPLLLLTFINNHSSNNFKYTGFVFAMSFFQMTGVFSVAFSRMSNYFVPFYWLLVAEVIGFLYTKYRKGIVVFISSILMLYFYEYNNMMSVDPQNEPHYFYERYIPYNNILI